MNTPKKKPGPKPRVEHIYNYEREDRWIAWCGEAFVSDRVPADKARLLEMTKPSGSPTICTRCARRWGRS